MDEYGPNIAKIYLLSMVTLGCGTGQCFSNFTRDVNLLEVLLKCRFWFSGCDDAEAAVLRITSKWQGFEFLKFAGLEELSAVLIENIDTLL